MFRRALSYFVPGVALLVFVVLHWQATGGPALGLDDAYITQHNARALLDGVDPNFAEATPLHGSTSAIHVAILALLGLVAPLAYAQFWFGVFAGLLYVFGLVQLARVSGAAPWSAALFATLALIVGDTPHHLLNGLETGLAMAAITWLLVALASPGGERWAVPLLAGSLPFLRPELAALSGLLLVAVAFDSPTRMQTFVTMCTRAALAAAPWALWYTIETGFPWPPTIEAKQLYFAEWCFPLSRRWELFAPPLLRFTLLVGTPLLGLVVLGRNWRGRAALIFTTLLLTVNLLKFPTSIDQYEHRYLYVLMPLLWWGLADALFRSPQLWLRRAAFSVLAVAAVHSSVALPSRFEWHRNVLRGIQRDSGETVAWLKTHLAPDARLLVHDAGFISVDTKFALVDLVGLKTPSSVPVNREAGEQVCGHGQQGVVAAIIAFQQRADTFVVMNTWDNVFQLRDGLEQMGFVVTRLDEERGESVYRVYKLSPPNELRSH